MRVTMNPLENDRSLESLLRSPPLREPGTDLDARVHATLASFALQRTRRIRLHRMALAAGLLIAAGVGIRLSLPKVHPPVAQVPTKQPEPIRIERDTSTVYDDGVIAGADDSAYEKFRRRTVREIWYIDPATHAQVRMTIPTEQIVIQKLDAF
jgi:hypothetical protein